MSAPASARAARRRADLDRGAAREPAAHRERVVDQHVHPDERDARRDQFGGGAAHVVGPLGLGAFDLLVHRERHDLAREQRADQSYLSVRSRAEREEDVRLDRHRKDEAVVVVGMLADEVDAPRRPHDVNPPAGAEGLLELRLDLARVHVHRGEGKVVTQWRQGAMRPSVRSRVKNRPA
jgi:hypothetical protein